MRYSHPHYVILKDFLHVPKEREVNYLQVIGERSICTQLSLHTGDTGL